MMKMKTTCAALFALALPTLARAAIDTTIIYLNDDTSNVANVQVYVVPTNKILVIEHIQTTDRNQDLRIINYSGTTVLTRIDLKLMRDPTFNQTLDYQPSLKIPGGWTLTMQKNQVLEIGIFGLLVDASDLYAGISSTVEGFAKAGSGTLQSKVTLDAGRQAIVKSEESLDLATWAERTDAAIALGTSHSERIISLPLSPSVQVAFERAMIRSRRGSAGMPH